MTIGSEEMMTAVSGLVLLSILCASCATYTVRPVPVPRFEDMPVRQRTNAIAIGVDPFVQVDRLRQAFDEVLTERGVLAIQVWVQNQEDQPIRFFPFRNALVLPDGTEIFHTVPVQPPGSPGQRSQFCENALVFGGAMPGPALLVALGCGIFAAGRAANYQTEAARWEDYNNKQLQNATLAKDSWTHGFLFFVLPEDKRELMEATLIFKFTEVLPQSEDKEILGPEQIFRIPLTGLSVNSGQ